MKRIFTIVIILSTYVNSYAQNFPSVRGYSTIYTRNGTAVEGTLYYPLSSGDYNDALDYMHNFYPNATIVENPTSEYNCYSYAFHLSEGNTQRVWINPTTTTNALNLSNYWTDGSFIQVCNESESDKADYYLGGHAAVTTSSISGQYESKWGPNCRVIHAPTYCPYDPNRIYYASTKIIPSATTSLCSGTRIFTVRNISGATYTWTYSAYLIPSGATNTSSFTVQRNGSSSGTGWVKVEISTPCSGSPVSTQVNFAVGAPAVPDLTINGVAPYEAIDATVTTDEPPPYSWYVDGNFIKTTTDKRTLYDLIPAGTCGEYHSLTVRVDNACGSTTSYPSTYSYSCNSYRVSPNPASSEVTVTTDQTTTTTGKTGTAAITEINIYDQQGFLKKKQKFGQVNRAVVNLDGLSTGVYFIEIVSGTYRERKQLSILK